MSSFRQIEANRRNARLSTGPVTEQGKKRSRQNALRHGLTAETVIDGLEDYEDYAAFEMAVTSDYDAQTAVGRELVLRLASVLWRLRRATAIEAGLFEQQARVQLQFRQRRQTQQARQKIMNEINKEAIAENDVRQEEEKFAIGLDPDAGDQFDGLTRAYVRLSGLPTYPLDRLGRYEATLWRQACQILFALQRLDRRKPWRNLRLR